MLTHTRPSSVSTSAGPRQGAVAKRTELDHAPARARWTVEVALVGVLYVAYDTTRGLRRGSIATADRSGRRLLAWEQTLHLDPEHTLNQVLWHVPALAVAASYFYASLHFIITPAVLIWMYRRHPSNYRSARTALVIGTILALVLYWLIPTAPPRLLPGGGFHDILSHVHQWGWWSNEGSAPRGLGGLTNQLAAMPSLHVGWALWSGWLVARHARRPAIRLLGAAYPVLTALVVMGTGNHYLLDAFGGVIVIGVGAGIASLMARRAARRQLVVPDPSPTWNPLPTNSTHRSPHERSVQDSDTPRLVRCLHRAVRPELALLSRMRCPSRSSPG